MTPLNRTSVIWDYSKNFSSNRKKNQESLQFGLNSIYITMLTIISALIFYYVILINTNATLGYDIRDLEDIQRNLILEEELLDVKIAELESLTNILKDNATDTMETVQETDFLVIKDDVQYVYHN